MAEDDRIAKSGPAWMAAGLLALTFALSVFRFLNDDEVEHVHSAWHVLNGALPYVDFFEHHHPLLWYVLAPVLAVTGESARAVIGLRVVFFLVTPAIAWATYRLARECRASPGAAWLSVFVLLSTTTFVYVAVAIRPDVPQTLFGVVSALYFARMLRTGSGRDAALSGFFGAVAFLFLQKAILLLALYPVPFVLFAARRQLPWRVGLYLIGAFAAACVPFAAFLLATGSFDEYLVTNWLMNARVGAGPAPVSFLSPIVLRDFARNAVFWGCSLAAAATAVRRGLACRYALPAWFGLGLVALLFSMNRVVDRYLVAAVPFLAVAASQWLADEIERRRIRGQQAAAVLLLVCLVPGAAMVRSVFRSNRGQLAQIQFVLDHSNAGDRMYDERPSFNLFRPDMHYFWFMRKPGIRLYNSLAGDRFADYDVCRLLATIRPRFVSNRAGNLERCGLASQYRPTPFGGLLELARE